ncbi:histidinol dehydrogenase [Cohaesibacter celericrescens]|uniref:Histidinol dehydrogenase n=1 Tax=Cohaesibacter celericrescens TaxID=2067669 RepID=A0A2N5XX15_9HYPH|nr:histidinol dehydrogenase [Cohaesibacter celericrescens]PLW79051.1 histidinol dehydrogenase [Cohaesibacter celericrescens]
MAIRLDASDSNFETAFRDLLSMKREVSDDVDAVVRDIIEDVKTRGDDALYDYTAKFDRFDARPKGLRISQEEIDAAVAKVDPDVMAALVLARDRIQSHHARQMPKNDTYEDALGVKLGSRWTAVQAVGIYVPGGLAAYPSSVLMNAVPAKVAGVERLVMVVPTPDGTLNPLVLAAAKLAGVDEIYRVGGAQAVAALAYGTDSIAPVYKIVGPGNAFVAAAKRRVFGLVGIDMIAGPSEVLIMADKNNDPDWLAVDLMAQAEHDMAAQSILITNDVDLADATEAAVERVLTTLPKAEIAGASWRDYGAVIIVPDWKVGMMLANRIAPEHLELAMDGASDMVDKVHNAGAIFVGHFTPEAVGDYVGGSNHVLPTARSARFSSGLSTLDFVKRTSVLECNAMNLREIGPAAVTLARQEGLEAHALSVAKRLNMG